MYYEYQDTKSSVEKEIIALEEIFNKPLANAIWNYDIAQTETILKSIHSLHFITGVKLISKEGVVTTSLGDIADSYEMTHSFKIEESFYEKKQELGSVELFSSSGVILERVEVGFYTIVIAAIIKSVILWILLLWAFNKFLTKPITNFARKVDKIDLENIEDSLVEIESVPEKERAEGELKLFKESFLTMLRNIGDSRDKLLDVEREKQEQQNIILLQYKKAAMGELIGVIAHQLKQPLNVISINTELIKQSHELDILTKEKMEKQYESINNNIEFMSESIDELKNLFNPNREQKPFDVTQTVEQALSLFSAQAAASKITFHRDMSSVGAAVGFKNDLEQVILNILSNSKDVFMSKEIKDPQIDVRLYKESEKIVITLEDNGGGIDEAIIESIFDIYFSTKGEKGTGIGLNLAKMIVEQNMNGKLSVRNSESGAMFIIKIPVNKLEMVP